MKKSELVKLIKEVIQENEENDVPKDVDTLVKKLRELESQYKGFSYQRGTDGKKGLAPKIKSLRSQIYKLSSNFSNPEWKVFYNSSFPYWFCKKKEEIQEAVDSQKKYKIKISRSGTFGNSYPDRFC